MKQLFILIRTTLVLLLVCNAAVYADPVFYLKNKSKSNITFDLKQQGKAVLPKSTTITARGEFTLDALDRDKDTVLEIYFSSCQKIGKCEKGEKPSIPKKLTATILASPENKTVYLKFRGNGKLLAQRGKNGMTENKKYSIAHNITSDDMTVPKITDISK